MFNLFCKHKYILYDKNKTTKGFGDAFDTYSFVCTKCKSTIKIDDNYILDVILYFKDKYRKNILLNKINKIQEKEICLFRMGSFRFSYENEGVTLAINYFNKKGIDIEFLCK